MPAERQAGPPSGRPPLDEALVDELAEELAAASDNEDGEALHGIHCRVAL